MVTFLEEIMVLDQKKVKTQKASKKYIWPENWTH